jgi:Domain of unknown function (DUF4476)
MKTLYTLLVLTILSSTSFASELFIRVNRVGTYYASTGNQTQYNNSNIFRFFDIPGGMTNLVVTDQYSGIAVFSSIIKVDHNQRIVGEIDSYGSFNILQTAAITNTNWYSPSPSQPIVQTPVHCGTPVPPMYGSNNSNVYFEQFKQTLKDESFDSNRLKTAKNYASKTPLSSQQISEVAKIFTFDSNRLEFAKSAYTNCMDQQNYFLLKNSFQFSSNYSALEGYIEGQ